GPVSLALTNSSSSESAYTTSNFLLTSADGIKRLTISPSKTPETDVTTSEPDRFSPSSASLSVLVSKDEMPSSPDRSVGGFGACGGSGPTETTLGAQLVCAQSLPATERTSADRLAPPVWTVTSPVKA